MKYFSIIFILFLFSCSTTDENNFIDQEKVLLDKILLSDLTHFDTLTKDTLIISLRPHIWCGTDKGIYVNGNALFDNVKERATKYGFKKVILDTSDALDINQPLYRNIPHYSLLISLSSDKGYIEQTYYYHSGPKVIQTIKDTIIDL